MKIGLVNIYSFRPHVEHLYYLSEILKDAGHEVFFLTCDSSVSLCYPRILKNTGRLKECSKCILGGVRSFPVSRITSISDERSNESVAVLEGISLSSSCTLTRTESDEDWGWDSAVQIRHALHEPIDRVIASTAKWIEGNALEGVICFNGRMDLTRAVTYACERAGVPYVTHERTWFGHGLHLVPNANCLSLRAINKIASEFQDKPLTKVQAQLAGKLAGERFLQQNALEWRVYNKNPKKVSWPVNGQGKRVLILPSSRNEFAGHEERKAEWKDNTLALDDFFEAFGIKPEQVVLRCHPNWSEGIGKVRGDRAINLYKEWADKRGIYSISSAEKANTYDLIQQADIVVLNGGSSAVEAGVCGKQVICLGPATYAGAGFVRFFCDRASLYAADAMTPIDADTVIRKTLRFLYVAANRFPQFVGYVRALQTTKYEYYQGGDVDRLIDLLKTGVLKPDDASFAIDSADEDAVVQAVKDRDWKMLSGYCEPESSLQRLDIGRRKWLRWVDAVRSRLSLGDRM